MNLVALLIAPAVVTLALDGKDNIRMGISLTAVAIIVGAVINSKRRAITVGEE
jgi:K(+)-stimulated pyrophosphate-energized sodium pump